MKTYLILLTALLTVTFAQAQTLKVMTYNIHVGQDASNKDQLKNIGDFIKSSGAELVGLQEVDSVCGRTGNVDQMKVLAEITGMHFAYARHFAFDGGAYGVGILSRYPLSDVTDHRVILTSNGTADAATRAFLTASITKKGRKVTFATIHMDYRDSDSRFAQSEAMLSTLSQISGPVILTGDFNARPGSREIENLKTRFADISGDEHISFPAVKPAAKIDYIMVNRDAFLKDGKTRVQPVTYSDHLPVESKIRLRNRR